MALGDGIRRNIASVDPSERDLLRDAFIELNNRFFLGTRTDSPTGGVSWWFKQDEIHQATHVHGGAEFLPWHRVICNRLEELLRQIDPRLSLHYWDFNDNPSPLFTTPADDALHYFMGSASGAAGNPWLDAGFYDPDAGTAGHPEDRDAASGTPADPPTDISRSVSAGSLLPIADISGGSAFGITCPVMAINNDADITSAGDFSEFRVRLECVHNFAHGHIGGTLSDAHISFRDPIVFLVHANVDRIFARWQTDPAHPERLVPETVYGADSGDSEINDDVEPWSGGADTRPWSAPESQGVSFNYKHASVVVPPCYDTNHNLAVRAEVVNPGTPAVINFNDIPSGDTAARAASFRIYGCGDATIRVKPGFEPAAPFNVLFPLSGQVVVPHEKTLYTEAYIWLAYTAGAAEVPVADGSVTFQCIESGQEFAFIIKANSIVRPRVAVMLSLDQSGSMNDYAGTSGNLRIDVLKSAATTFVDVIKAGNGVGLIRFDTDAYPVADATYPGLAVTRIIIDEDFDAGRLAARDAVSRHATNINGWTSIGDGLQLARNILNAVPAADYEQKAIIVFTDGLETADVSIASVAGSIDNRTFAIGLGNELQVNTASLKTLTQGTGGYLKLTGILSADINDYFRTSKYFLQILSGVTNDEIVLDPSGYIAPGIVITIPFVLNEADIDATVILLTDFPVVDMEIQTPGGDIINPVNAAGIGISYSAINLTRHYRFTLPVAFVAGNHAGNWKAILKINEAEYKQYASSFDNNKRKRNTFTSHGARYSLIVNTYSNLKMKSTITQQSYEPGAMLTLRSIITEYGIPVAQRASVHAEITRPDGTSFNLSLIEDEPGVFENSFKAHIPGTYNCRMMAAGATIHGRPFTREITQDGAVYRGGDQPAAPTRPDNELPANGENGGLGTVPSGNDKLVKIIGLCCRRNSLILWFIALLLLIIAILLWRL